MWIGALTKSFKCRFRNIWNSIWNLFDCGFELLKELGINMSMGTEIKQEVDNIKRQTVFIYLVQFTWLMNLLNDKGQ